MRILIVVALVSLLFLGLPLLNHAALPHNFSPEEIGGFISTALAYWKTLFGSIAS